MDKISKYIKLDGDNQIYSMNILIYCIYEYMNIIHSCSKLGGDKLDGDKRPHKGLVPEFASAPTNNLAIQAAGKNPHFLARW